MAAFFIFLYPKTYFKVSAKFVIWTPDPLLVSRCQILDEYCCNIAIMDSIIHYLTKAMVKRKSMFAVILRRDCIHMSNSAVLLIFELLFDIFRYTHYTEFCTGYSS